MSIILHCFFLRQITITKLKIWKILTLCAPELDLYVNHRCTSMTLQAHFLTFLPILHKTVVPYSNQQQMVTLHDHSKLFIEHNIFIYDFNNVCFTLGKMGVAYHFLCVFFHVCESLDLDLRQWLRSMGTA